MLAGPRHAHFKQFPVDLARIPRRRLTAAGGRNLQRCFRMYTMLDSGLEGVIDSAQGLHPMFAVARCPVGSLTRWHASATAAAGRKRKMIPKRFRDRGEAGRVARWQVTGLCQSAGRARAGSAAWRRAGRV